MMSVSPNLGLPATLCFVNWIALNSNDSRLLAKVSQCTISRTIWAGYRRVDLILNGGVTVGCRHDWLWQACHYRGSSEYMDSEDIS